MTSIYRALQDMDKDEIERLIKKLEREEKKIIAGGASREETNKIRSDIRKLKRAT
jgi:hypothetical protein